MAIKFNNENKTFHLQTINTSYIMKILKYGYLGHLYWGKRIREINDLSYFINYEEQPLEPYVSPEDKGFSLDRVHREYPGYGRTDFHDPAYQVKLKNGSRITDLKYKSHEIIAGKEDIPGLPATYVEDDDQAETLKIKLGDDDSGLEIGLYYTVFPEFDVITRSAVFYNQSQRNVNLKRALSIGVDFFDSKFDLIQLSGAWARERHIKRRSLETGIQSVKSSRGFSGPYQNPFIALARENTDEFQGEVYGFNLVYSGNFLAQVEVDHYQNTRVTMGINPFDFQWLLCPGESFYTPEVVMVYTDQGLNKMSQVYHDLYRKRLVRGKYRDQIRPILVNNWEATYFDFDTEKILDIAGTARELGIELFVLDDGWFGKRNDDTSSLGDWRVNRDKIPEGLKGLGKKINNLGLDFGIWVEPEMVSPDSKLYRQHPDWCIHVPEKSRSQARNQLVLDLSRPEVCEYLIESISSILTGTSISYVKWDANRHLTEIGSAGLPPERQMETAHRYVLGLYYILEELTERFPDILFESCASGGGRFDPGMLYYMPQTWTSDDTDAVERLKIQYGTSMVYPLNTMGAHVSSIPNHQVGRVTPLVMRGNVAMFGQFGYELDLTELTEAEKSIIRGQVKAYKERRQLIHQGDFYRLSSPFQSNEIAWAVISKDKKEALIGFYKILAKPNHSGYRFRLRGLDPETDYRLAGTDLIFGGDKLMYAGLDISRLESVDSGGVCQNIEKQIQEMEDINFIDMDNLSIEIGDFRSRIFKLEAIN